jgi:tRNA U34 5-carboxymethylaminomethyl modifying GTPase MnmE/TrmE
MPENISARADIASQLKKTDQELKEAQSSVKTGMINVKVLMDFRNATERARQASAAVQQWLEAQGKSKDPYQMMPRVMSERVHMANELLKDVARDLEGGDLDYETPGLGELNKTVKSLADLLGRLFSQ